MKHFILGLVFNNRQRQIIWNALLFSAHTYLRRGNAAKAAEVQQVINETGSAFGARQLFTKEEVDNLMAQAVREVRSTVDETIEKVRKEAYHVGFDTAVKALAEGEIEIETATVHIVPKNQDGQEQEQNDGQDNAEQASEGEGKQKEQNDGEQALEMGEQALEN